MRNRGHMCAACVGGDEAHHKRHLGICEQLRFVYELNGEHFSLIPAVEGPRDHDNAKTSDSDDRSRSSSVDSLPITKKLRKDAKKLAKAAGRSKVITYDEIEYVGSILHLLSSTVGADGPDNMREVDEIEKHLRHNANVYNKGVKRSVLSNFANIPDAGLNFEHELGRILDDLKVTDLLKRNTKNRGLQGKELKTFESLVASLTTMIVEDLGMVKRDEMETRMRRAGYSRYANRTSFAIFEDRYANKYRKTGERIIAFDTDAPLQTPVAKSSTNSTRTDMDQKENTPASTNNGPDLRHLTCSHKKVGFGGKDENVLPIGTDPSLKQANPKPPQPRLTLSVVANSSNIPTPQPANILLSSCASNILLSSFTRQLIVGSSFPPQNAWPKPPISIEQPHLIQASSHKRPTDQKIIEPTLVQKKITKVDDVVVQPISRTLAAWPVEKTPDVALAKNVFEVKNVPRCPPASQTKSKKKSREAKRKDKKKVALQAEAVKEPEAQLDDKAEEIDQQLQDQVELIETAKDAYIHAGGKFYLRKSEDFRVSVVDTAENDIQGDDNHIAN
jgi:hypothetical protein